MGVDMILLDAKISVIDIHTGVTDHRYRVHFLKNFPSTLMALTVNVSRLPTFRNRLEAGSVYNGDCDSGDEPHWSKSQLYIRCHGFLHFGIGD
ncbi:hypothetical protein HA466_0002670 [Hirschfeldia incana]|nr:hypothetical protein HA466_0002670 [Hirschfeldia incana]